MTPGLTNAGHMLLLRALEGAALKFTKIQLGNGATQSIKSATTLSNPLITLQLAKMIVADQYITLTSSFSNDIVADGFRITEVGVWAEDPDNAGGEILYALGNEDEGTADYVPSRDNRILEMEYSILIFVGEAQNVTAEISESLAYASAAELKAHVEDTANPHGVTKGQVGLGNVPNVATNDQTPTYSTAAALTGLVSGEKLSAAFGKLARAVRSLVDHLNDKVRHITAAERNAWNGKADGSHNHGAADINSGTLGVSRGGTGKTSWSANRLLYPTAAAVLGQLAFPPKDGMVLYQDRAGAPYWGDLPDAPFVSETGTYTGRGRTGSASKNTITFQGGAPKIVFIKNRSMAEWGILLPAPGAATGWSSVGSTQANLIVSTSGNTVSWYYNSTELHPANQLDTNGVAYAYVAIF